LGDSPRVIEKQNVATTCNKNETYCFDLGGTYAGDPAFLPIFTDVSEIIWPIEKVVRILSTAVAWHSMNMVS
jgi:hypothetical protein